MILWGHNPTETILVIPTISAEDEAERYAVYVVDPRHSTPFRRWRISDPATAHHRQCADGRDEMYVIISENLHDRSFIARYAIGLMKTNAGRRTG